MPQLSSKSAAISLLPTCKESRVQWFSVWLDYDLVRSPILLHWD